MDNKAILDKGMTALARIISFFFLIPLMIFDLAVFALVAFFAYLVSKTMVFFGILLAVFCFFLIMFSISFALGSALQGSMVKLKIQYIMILSLIGIVFGVWYSIDSFGSLKKVKIDKINLETIEKDYDYIDLSAVYNNFDGEVNYVIDNSLNGFTINITYDKDLYKMDLLNEGNNHYINGYEYAEYMDVIDLYVSYMKQGYWLDLDDAYPRVTVYANEDHINEMIQNSSKIKRVSYYDRDGDEIKVNYSLDIRDDQECNLNENLYYECY